MTDTFGTNAPATDDQSGGTNVTEQAKEKVAEVADQAREATQQMRSQGRGMLRDKLDERSSRAGQQVHTTAQSLRRVSGQLRSDGQVGPARVVEQVADKGEQLAGYLRTTDGERMMRDAQDLARRNPWAIVAGGMAIGFIGSRVLKSAADRERSVGRASMYPSESDPGFKPSETAPAPRHSDVQEALESSAEIFVERRSSSDYTAPPVPEGR